MFAINLKRNCLSLVGPKSRQLKANQMDLRQLFRHRKLSFHWLPILMAIFGRQNCISRQESSGLSCAFLRSFVMPNEFQFALNFTKATHNASPSAFAFYFQWLRFAISWQLFSLPLFFGFSGVEAISLFNFIRAKN